MPSADSLLQQMFIVRFLGSMAVNTDSTAEVIYEAMRQVLAARAIHNIFRMTETHLMVTSQTLRLIDPQTQVTRANFELTSVTQFAAHQENKRLVGFVVRMPESTGGESLSTYIFESNSEGEKVLTFFFILRFQNISVQTKIFTGVFYTTPLDTSLPFCMSPSRSLDNTTF